MSINDLLKKNFQGSIVESHQNFGDETVVVERKNIFEVLRFLRDCPDSQFDLMLDICGVDYLGKDPRFEVVYHLYSLSKKARIRVRTRIPESDPVLQSVISLWKAADWFEREVFDMFGVIFDGHPNLKRLLMWNEFKGHPLRKDYPLDKRQPIPKTEEIV